MATLAVVKNTDGWESPPPLGVELGSSFGYQDRLFYGWSLDGDVIDYADIKAQDLTGMFKRDYQARKIESVLALPIMSAERKLAAVKGDKGELDWLEGFWDADPLDGGCQTELDTIIGSHTTAISYYKAFWELVFKEGYDSKIVYDKVAFRPQTTCRTMRDSRTGELTGFEQEPYAAHPSIEAGHYPIQIPMKRAYIYVHGQRLDPINGTSDLEIAHWCYKTKQKLLFLWYQFLESVALPRTVVKATDTEVAKQIAAQIARMRGSAVIPIGTGGQTGSVDVSTLDSSGKGSDQFQAAIMWLDQAATQSVLAGFVDLTQSNQPGNYAISKDAGSMFLQFEEAKCREIERAIRRDLFAPLIRYNFGRRAAVPKLKFEPLNSEDKTDQIGMLNALMANRTAVAKIPEEFIAELAAQVGNYFGMDPTKIHDAFIAAAKEAQALAAAQSAAGASPLGQQAAALTGVTNAAAGVLGGNAQQAKPPNPNKAAQAAGAVPNGRQARQVGGQGGGGRSVYQP